MRARKIIEYQIDATGGAATHDLSTIPGGPATALEDALALTARAVTLTLYNAGTATAEVRLATTTAGLSAEKVRPDETLELGPLLTPDTDRYILDAPMGADILVGVWEMIP